ncbi:permease [Clostridium sp. D2Q-11]|uniref:Permease n=1 Tax=Anaeromonas frigoriresistens TaxID=2683708 RepID=A0A942UXW8_9FIRM|nr:permease [Anaeromonas frigoriresistens]MBS4538991.1 permease [Anaeromonas frigoriresistens]
MINILKDIVWTVLRYLKADWWILLIGILLAVCIRVYVDENSFNRYLKRNSKASILSSIGFGALTPLCACGTMAVLLSMFITSMPWGPVMAFLVSSPLTSPSEFMFQTAFFGTKFAIVVVISSILLGLLAGLFAHFLDLKTNFFKGQFRIIKDNDIVMGKSQVQSISCCSVENDQVGIISSSSSCCSNKETLINKLKIKDFIREFINLGIKKVLLYFIIFIAIGRVAELIIPKEWIMSLFSSNRVYSIPLGAIIGLPLYVSGPSALPLMKSFMNSGASSGVLLAFLITGKATGVPVIAGMSTILKKRAILFYVLFVYLGGVIFGYVYQLLMSIS